MILARSGSAQMIRALRLAEFFALDVEVIATDVPLSEIFDSDQGVYLRVQNDDVAYPCLAVLPMGWRWSLYFG